MPASRTDIMNDALRLIGVKPIASPDEKSEPARQIGAIYDRVIRFELEQYPWAFAKKEATLPANLAEPSFRYERSFNLPADFLRMVEFEDRWVWVIDSGVNASPVKSFEIFGRTIRTNEGAPLKITYIADLSEDPSLWTATFSRMASCALARDVAPSLNRAESWIKIAEDRYRQTELRARRSAAIQRAPSRTADGSWLTSRFY